jgi:hypothetical protein
MKVFLAARGDDVGLMTKMICQEWHAGKENEKAGRVVDGKRL